MYKVFRVRRYRITFNTFNSKVKNKVPVFKSGFRCWETVNDNNYSIVLGTFRIIFSIEKSQPSVVKAN